MSVSLFEHCDYKGQNVTLAPGNYPFMPVQIGSGLSSIKIPSYVRVTLYEGANYQGGNLRIDGPRTIDCLTSLPPWNDRTRSIKIELLPKPADTVNRYGLLSNNLQCYLDARQVESYDVKSQPKIWRDLSGYNRHFSWNDAPAHTDGRFTWIGSRQAVGPASNSFGFGSGQNGVSVVVISRQRGMSANRVFRFAEQKGNYGFGVHQTWNNNFTYFDNMGLGRVPTDGTNRLSVNIGDKWNQTSVWSYVRTSTGELQIYHNGVLLKTTDKSQRATPLDLSDKPVLINDSRNWDADIAVFAVYNSELSAAQIAGINRWWQQSEKTRREMTGKLSVQMTSNHPALADFPVTMGLQCYLDTYYRQSYPGRGLEWRDLSPHGRHFRFKSNPTCDGYSLINRGGAGQLITGPASNSFGIDEASDYTIVWYCKTDSLGQNAAFQFYASSGQPNGARGIFCHPTWTDQKIYFDQGGCCNTTHRLVASVGGYWQHFNMYAIVRDQNGRHLYINGTRVATTRDRGVRLNLNRKPVTLLSAEGLPIWNVSFRAFAVYNTGLSLTQLGQLAQWFRSANTYQFNPHLTWEQASRECQRQNSQLCYSSQYCPADRPVGRVSDTEIWAPVANESGQWIQIGARTDQCRVRSEQNIPKNARRAFKCCQPSTTRPFFDTIGQIGEDECLMFKDKMVLRYNFRTHQSRLPVPLTTLKFTGLFAEGGFKACVDYPETKTLYLFKDNLVIKYNYINGLISDPMSINSLYPILPINYQNGEFSCVFRLDGNQIAFVSGPQMLVYEQSGQTARIVSQTQIANHWPGITHIFQSGNWNAVLRSSPEEYIIFKESQFITYNKTRRQVTGPLNIIPNWSGLRAPFVKDNELCVTYKEQYRRLQAKNDTQSREYGRQIERLCTQVSYDDHLRALEQKRIRLHSLLTQITQGSDQIAERKAKIEAVRREIEKVRDQLKSYEQHRECPSDEKCDAGQLNWITQTPEVKVIVPMPPSGAPSALLPDQIPPGVIRPAEPRPALPAPPAQAPAQVPVPAQVPAEVPVPMPSAPGALGPAGPGSALSDPQTVQKALDIFTQALNYSTINRNSLMVGLAFRRAQLDNPIHLTPMQITQIGNEIAQMESLIQKLPL